MPILALIVTLPALCTSAANPLAVAVPRFALIVAACAMVACAPLAVAVPRFAWSVNAWASVADRPDAVAVPCVAISVEACVSVAVRPEAVAVPRLVVMVAPPLADTGANILRGIGLNICHGLADIAFISASDSARLHINDNGINPSAASFEPE